MAEIVRDVVYPKKVWPPGFAEPVDLAPLVPFLKKRQEEFLAAGLPIPYVWRHDDQAVPGQLAKLLQGDGRLSLGWVKTAEVDDAGILVNRLEVPSDEDCERVKANRHVSPWIKWNWRDGSGKVWEGPSILHVAVAPRPVQIPTRPVPLSHDAHADLWLALGDYERGESMATEETPPVETPKETKEEKKEGYQDAELKDVLEGLAESGLPLPDTTSKKDFFDNLRAALKIRKAMNGGGSSTSAAPAPVEAAPTPTGVTMAHDDKPSKADLRNMKRDRKAMEDQITLALKEGRCDGPMAQEQLAALKELKLSYDDEGEIVPNKVSIWLSFVEKNPKGTFFPIEQRLAHKEVDDPDPGVSEGRPKLNPEVMAKLTGGMWKPPAA